jgi:leucine dehydrogenase
MSPFAKSTDDAHEGVRLIQDEVSGLRSNITIHSTGVGPLAGDCRVWECKTEEQAFARLMSLNRSERMHG